MYNNGGNYGSGHLMSGLNPLQITPGPSGFSPQKLSFLNPSEQAKFEQLFQQNVSSPNQQLTGEAARDIFFRSKLDSEVLAQIWSLADINASGSLTFPEFALAMYLINMKLTGQIVPNQLPGNLRQEITSAMQSGGASNMGPPNVGTPNSSYSGYYSPGPNIPGVTTPLGGTTPGMNVSSPQYGGYTNPKSNDFARSQWAVTPEEKAQFDQIFKSLDNTHSGFLSGEKARQVFTESGLNTSDLGQIWGLADVHNQGKLNSDEFAVAMHLIYAKLAGQEIPKTLPVNLIPPSTKDLSDSVSNLKNMLKTNASLKKSATLSSPILGIPKLNFDLNSSSIYSEKKPAGRDEDTGYVSGNRRKIGTSPNSSSPNLSYSERLAKFDSLRKQIKEKQAELENLSAKTSQPSFTSSSNNEVDLTELKVKIKKLQDSINEISLPSKNYSKERSDHNPEAIKEERKKLESEFADITSELPSLTKKVHTLDEKLAESRLELFKVTDAKLHKTAAPKTNLANLFPFKASGSNENLTEADKLKQKAAEMLAQRMQALTKADVSPNDPSAIEAKKRLDAETEKINKEKKANERYIREAEDSIRQLQESIRDIIQRDSKSTEKTSYKAPKDDYEKEKKKWDSRFGLETEIKKFLDELKECERKSTPSTGSYSTQYSKPSYLSSSGTRSVAGIPSKISSASSKPSILTSAKSKEEKDRIIKEEAERRLKERQSFFQTQFQRTKEQKNSLESKVEKVENSARSGGDSDYAREKLASIEREKEEIGKKFLQRSREFSDVAEKTKEERSQVDSIQTSTNHTSSDAVPPPPPPPPPANKSGGSSLGGYKTLWLNNPSSTKSGSQPSKSVTPSFIPKSNNPFPVSTSGKVKSPVVPKPTTKDDSEDEDEDDKEKENLFQDRIEKAKREEQERTEAHEREQEAIREATRTARERAKNLQTNSRTESKTPAFLGRSNNVFTKPSFGTQSTELAKPPSEPSHSPKDDEWDVVEKETINSNANPSPGHTNRSASSFFSSISSNIPSSSPQPSHQIVSPTSKFDEAFGIPSESTPDTDSHHSTAFDDAFNIPSEPIANQESHDQSEKPTEVVEDEPTVLFRVRTLYEYQAEGADDLGFLENDYIQVSQSTEDSDWWYGELESNGAKGWFPKSYVEQEDLNPQEILADLDTPVPQPFLARVLYDYQAQQEDELSVSADAVVDILEKIDENWWRAQIDGHIGLIPATYCEELTQ